MEQYFLIYTNEDGEARVLKMSKQELQDAMGDPELKGWLKGENAFNDKDFNDATAYWGENFLIIKGSIVTPKPVQKIIEWEIE